MGLLDMLTQVRQMKADIQAGRYVDAWEHSLPFQQGLIDIARASGVKGSPDDAQEKFESEQTKADIKACCEECVAELSAVGADPVGKIFPGDGTFVKLLIELFLKYGPLFI